jgi:cytochrome c553
LSENVTPEAVEQLVQEVSAWYAEQIITERRAGAPDAERLQDLKEQLAACAADQQALQDADDDQVAEIAARYAARVKELRGQ